MSYHVQSKTHAGGQLGAADGECTLTGMALVMRCAWIAKRGCPAWRTMSTLFLLGPESIGHLAFNVIIMYNKFLDDVIIL